MKQILLLIIFLFSHNCSSPNYDPDIGALFIILCYGSSDLRSQTKTEYEREFTDLKNGMILYTSRKIIYSKNACEENYHSGVLNSESQTYYKKCVQGQVYRSEQNDCKGTGDSSNFYGARQFAFCNTNDNSCESNSGNADPFSSPAALSCYNETLYGRSWKIKDVYQYSSYESKFINYLPEEKFKEYFSELPKGDTVYFWDLDSSSSEYAYKYSIDGNGKINSDKDYKTSSHYVICENSENEN
ncbi:MAG: hypothetical protein H7A25_04185 [Leptospiraceae bacterium]|nr:hypothetical protein [Leptospiraceae bacterium]MCP5499075.1 hypothetical protein [Leptospiraceae bacterium]